MSEEENKVTDKEEREVVLKDVVYPYENESYETESSYKEPSYSEKALISLRIRMYTQMQRIR